MINRLIEIALTVGRISVLCCLQCLLIILLRPLCNFFIFQFFLELEHILK